MSIGQLAIMLEGIRNKLLYPYVTPDDTYEGPQQALTPTESERLAKRVAGIINAVSREL